MFQILFISDELIDILVTKRPDGEDPKFYKNFAHILVNIFCQLCRDIMELQHQVINIYFILIIFCQLCSDIMVLQHQVFEL